MVHDVSRHNFIFSRNGALVHMHVWLVAEHAEPAIPVARQTSQRSLLVVVQLRVKLYEPHSWAMRQSKTMMNFDRKSQEQRPGTRDRVRGIPSYFSSHMHNWLWLIQVEVYKPPIHSEDRGQDRLYRINCRHPLVWGFIPALLKEKKRFDKVLRP